MASDRVNEDRGPFAYARIRTPLFDVGQRERVIGWLDPGARVGVAAVQGEHAVVVLFAWSNARALVRESGLSAEPVAAAFTAVTHPVRTVSRGASYRGPGNRTLGYTFCGDVEILATEANGDVHGRMREDGVVLDGVLKKSAWLGPGESCAHSAIVTNFRRARLLAYHNRYRAYHDHQLPASLVAVGPFEGPTFAKLIAKKRKVTWRESDGTCTTWQLSKRGLEQQLVEHGETVTVGYDLLFFGSTDQTTIALLGPGSNSKRGGYATFGCGFELRVVASDAHALTLLRGQSDMYDVVGYDPRDAERWYLDPADCERETQQATAAADPSLPHSASLTHRGC